MLGWCPFDGAEVLSSTLREQGSGPGPDLSIVPRREHNFTLGDGGGAPLVWCVLKVLFWRTRLLLKMVCHLLVGRVLVMQSELQRDESLREKVTVHCRSARKSKQPPTLKCRQVK